MAAVRELERRTPECLVSGEIFMRDDAATLLHGTDDQVRRLALVESIATTFCDATKHRRQLRCAPGVADSNELSLAQEQRGARRVLRQPLGAILIVIGER